MPTKDPEKRRAKEARYRARHRDAINARRRGTQLTRGRYAWGRVAQCVVCGDVTETTDGAGVGVEGRLCATDYGYYWRQSRAALASGEPT